MAKKPTTTTLADLVNSPEYKGMSDIVKAQIESALAESKGKSALLPKKSKTAISTDEVLANPAMVKAIKEKIGEKATEEFLKKADEKSAIDDTDKPIVIDKQNKVKKTKQKTKKQRDLEQQENTQKSFKDFILGKGSKAFNKMFPLLGALLGGVYRGGDKNKSNDTSQSNTRSSDSGVTAILSSIVSSQRTTNSILTEILNGIIGNRNNNPLAPGNNNPNTNIGGGGGLFDGLKSLLRLVGFAIGGVGLGIAGAAGVSALRNSGNDQQQSSDQNTPPKTVTTPANTSTAPRLISPNVNNYSPEPTPMSVDASRANASRVRLAGTTAAQLMGRGAPPAGRINSDTERAFNSLPPAQRGLISPNVNNYNPEPEPMRLGAAGRTFAGEENPLNQQKLSEAAQLTRPIENYIRSLNELDASENASNNVEGISIPHDLTQRNALENGFIQSLSTLNNVPISERPSPPEGTFERLRLIRQRRGESELPPIPGPQGGVFAGEQDNRSPSLISVNSVGNYNPEPAPSETTIPGIQQAQRARIELAGTTAAQLMGRGAPPAGRINSDTERAFNSITPATIRRPRSSDPLNWQGGGSTRSRVNQGNTSNPQSSQTARPIPSSSSSSPQSSQTARPVPSSSSSSPQSSQTAGPVPQAPSVSVGRTLSDVSTQNAIAERAVPAAPTAPPATAVDTPATPAPRTERSANPIDPDNPGPLEPSDASIRYNRLFSMVA